MVKSLLIGLIGLVFCASCHPVKELNQTDDDLVHPAAVQTYKSYYSKREISKSLYRSYKKLYGNGMSMADKSEDFNPSDVWMKRVPGRRFIFGANSVSGDFELFVFEEGGIALKNFCVISKKNAGSEGAILAIYLFGRPGDINALKEIIARKAYEISRGTVIGSRVYL